MLKKETSPPERAVPVQEGAAVSSQLRNFGWCVVALIALYCPVLWTLLKIGLSSELFSYILLIPFVSGYLAWRNRGVAGLGIPRRGIAIVFGMAAIACLGAYLFLGAKSQYFWISALSFVCIVAAAAFWTMSSATVRAFRFPLAFLLFLVPFPDFLTHALESFLQHGSANAAHLLFVVTGIPFLREGLIFKIPGAVIEVAPQCSGIRSTLVLFITSLIAGEMFLRSPLRKTLLCAVVLPLGILRNATRILVLAQLCSRYGPQVLESYIHRNGGPLFFALFLIPFLAILLWMLAAERKPGGCGHAGAWAPRQQFSGVLLCCAGLCLLGSGCSQQTRVEQLLRSARSEFKEGRADHAEIQYLRALKLDSANAVAIRELGILLHNEGRVAASLPVLERAVELDPSNSEARIKLALSYMGFKRFPEALAQAEAVLSKDPANEDAILLYADAASTRSELDRRMADIREHAKKHGESAPTYLAQGVILLKKQELPQAEEFLKQALARNTNSAAAWIALGNLYWARGDVFQADAHIKKGSELADPYSLRKIKYAEFKLQLCETNQAKALFEAASRGAPGSIRPLTRLAEIALNQGDTENCAALVKTVLRRDELDYDARVVQQKLTLRTKPAEEAMQGADSLVRLFPNSSEVLLQHALASLRTGDTAAAMRSLNRAIFIDPGMTDAVLLLAELEIRRNDPVSAVGLLKRLIERQPSLGKAYLLLGAAHLARRDLDEAIALYTQLSERFPENPEPYFFIARACRIRGDDLEARKACEKALQVSGTFLPPLEMLLEMDIAESRPAKALERVQEFIKHDGDRSELHLLRARALIALKRMPEAEKAALTALKLNPEFANTFHLLGQIYAATGREKEALAKLQQLTAIEQNVGAWMQIGTINESMKDYPAARNAYEKLLSLRPDFAPALNNLANLFSEKFNDLERAYALAQRARQAWPNDPTIADTLGWICYKRGDLRRAVGLLQESAARYSEKPEILYHLGAATYAAGYETQSKAVLEKAALITTEQKVKGEITAKLRTLAISLDKPSEADIKLLRGLAARASDPAALLRLAVAEQEAGNLKEAETLLLALLKACPEHPEGLLRLALLYSSEALPKPELAGQYAKKAFEVDSRSGRAAALVGRLAFQSGDFNGALRFLSEASRLEPDNTGACFDLAWAQYSVGRLEQATANMRRVAESKAELLVPGARQFLRFASAADSTEPPSAAIKNEASEVLKKDPENVPALWFMAVFYASEGKFPEAEELYDKVLQKYPLFAPAIRNQAILCYDQLNKPDKAQSCAVRAREIYTRDPELARILGMLAFSNKEYSRAATLLAESARSSVADPKVFYHLGLAQHHLHEDARARESLEKALQLQLPEDLAAEARKVLSVGIAPSTPST